jgi:hypothetical protein
MVFNLLQQHEVLRSEILIVVNIKIIVFWDLYFHTENEVCIAYEMICVRLQSSVV